MKNREKYREELINIIKLENNREGSNFAFCDFVKGRVLPNYITEDWLNTEDCLNLWCLTCNKIFSLWLDEEYEEPPKTETDWYHIPVDTLVRVRDYEDEEWFLRYFKGIDDSYVDRFVTWECGTTSVTAYGGTENWKYCELAEDENDGNSSI